jgi:hypothetical protein
MKLFLKIKSFIGKLFTTVRKEAKTIIPVGIKVVEEIKKFIDSPVADFLTSVIPGNVDDGVKLTLRKILPGILKGLRKWDSIVNITDENEQLKAIMEEFKTLSKVERDALKLQAATEINSTLLPDVELADAKIMTLVTYHYPELLNA